MITDMKKRKWKWEINLATKHVFLYENDGLRSIIMGFKRFGTHSAAPTFNVDGILKRCDAIATPEKGREHHEWHAILSHPDAVLIESAPQLLDACEMAVGGIKTLLAILGNNQQEQNSNELVQEIESVIKTAKGKI